ncbi:Uncharacterised protein [Mycolicibacterium fortuitum]|uniref:Uncharacterized protein n=1 Tax=Mycolicibacterium fortuitum TaxID=1766 RepID=A0A378WEG2_MYCFO|nr:Uncharacterised protein [Mycolicibacterium fortuitum]
MCRSQTDGGRRCPCARGDRRRAYQRLRYALRTAQSAPTDTDQLDPTNPAAPTKHQATGEDFDHNHRSTRAAADAALNALRTNLTDPQTRAEYLNALLDHGAALRDRAEPKLEAALLAHGLDDASIAAEAEQFNRRRIEAENAFYRIRDQYPPASEADITAARYAYIDAATTINRDIAQRESQLNTLRANVIRDTYYQLLSQERSFGTATITPTNHDKMTRADRSMLAATVALYPDDMIERSNTLLPMVAKRSKARAHYSRARHQKRRRTTKQVFDLRDALSAGRLASWPYVTNPAAMAEGNPADDTDRRAAQRTVLVNTPETLARVQELVDLWNSERPREPATLRTATRPSPRDGTPEQVIYVTGTRTMVTTHRDSEPVAELTYSDSRSMVHELGHRMEDFNPDISIATKEFLRSRTAGLPQTRYAKNEYVIEDGFASSYMGKDYPNTSFTELFSTGMEALTHGEYGGLRGRRRINLNHPSGYDTRIQPPRADPEHLALILGILSTANKPSQ